MIGGFKALRGAVWPGAAFDGFRRFLDLGIVAGAVLTFTKESRSLLNLLLVSRRHSAKGAPRVSFGSSLSLDPCGKAFMRLRHKGNFRAFLVVGFKGFLNSGGPSGEAPSGCSG